MRFHLTLLLLIGLAPFVSAPAQAGDLIDLAIEVVNPDLKPARPIVECAVKGNPIAKCALAQGKEELAKNEDVQRIFKVYNLAKKEMWAELVAEVGVTVACTAFDVPGSALVCNEFGAKVAEYGAKAVKLAAEVHKQVGEKLLNSVKNAGKKFGCVTGIYCKKQDKKDPNKFYWSYGSTTLSMPKFDLGAIWKADYASRIAEGINARLNDAAKLQRMVAVPPSRMTAADATSPYAQMLLGLKKPFDGSKSPSGGTGAKKQADTTLITAADLKYFLAQTALASKSMNDTTMSWFLTGATGDLTNVHLAAFEQFEREMNQRWLAEVNKAAGETLEQPAQDLLAAQESWRKQLIEPIGAHHFDSLSRTNQSEIANALAPCRAAVDRPAVMLARWAGGAFAAGNDTTIVAGRNASAWKKVGLKDWCAKLLAADMAARRHEYDAAVSWGCTRKTGPNAKGLDCPQKAIAKKPNFADDPGSWTSTPKGEVGVVPVELCHNAYRVNGVVSPAHCSVNRVRLPGVAAPLQPGMTTPETAPQPAEPPPPTFRIPPVRQQQAPQKSTLCLFDAGPRAGQRQDYAPMAPLPVGTPCHDARGSTGKVIAP